MFFCGVFTLSVFRNADAARGGGRRGGSRKSGRGGSRMQIFIPRNQDGVSYYDNTNVSIFLELHEPSASVKSYINIFVGCSYN